MGNTKKKSKRILKKNPLFYFENLLELLSNPDVSLTIISQRAYNEVRNYIRFFPNIDKMANLKDPYSEERIISLWNALNPQYLYYAFFQTSARFGIFLDLFHQTDLYFTALEKREKEGEGNFRKRPKEFEQIFALISSKFHIIVERMKKNEKEEELRLANSIIKKYEEKIVVSSVKHRNISSYFQKEV